MGPQEEEAGSEDYQDNQDRDFDRLKILTLGNILEGVYKYLN